MPKTLFCNSFETTHTKEVFLLLFRFQAPDGHEETVYIAISPSGAATFNEVLGKEIEEYVKKHGNIIMGDWEKPKESNRNNNNTTYLS